MKGSIESRSDADGRPDLRDTVFLQVDQLNSTLHNPTGAPSRGTPNELEAGATVQHGFCRPLFNFARGPLFKCAHSSTFYMVCQTWPFNICEATGGFCAVRTHAFCMI